MPVSTRKTTNDDTDAKVVHSAVRADKESLTSSIEVMPVEAENPQMASYIDELAFEAQSVTVTVLPNSDRTDTTKLVTVGVNGKQFHFLRGQPRQVPRYVLGKLARAKKEAWFFGYDKASDGTTRQTDQMQQYLRFPHHWLPHDPKNMAREQAWYERQVAMNL